MWRETPRKPSRPSKAGFLNLWLSRGGSWRMSKNVLRKNYQLYNFIYEQNTHCFCRRSDSASGALFFLGPDQGFNRALESWRTKYARDPANPERDPSGRHATG